MDGVVLIGDLPTATYEILAHGAWAYESFPCDLYFQDLHGIWRDMDGNGRYDWELATYVAPEIWLGRLTAGTLAGVHPGRSEAALLNRYFAKNHAYRTGQLTLSRDGLAYVDDDWRHLAGTWSAGLGAGVSGTVTLVRDGHTTVASDYMARLAGEYEQVFLAAHSGSGHHVFQVDGQLAGGYVYAADLEGLDPQVLFYNLFACSAANYTAEGYIAGEYVFGTAKGLLAVGSTKTGSMLDLGDFYTRLGEGATFGEAMRDWWLARVNGGYLSIYKDWYYGLTLIGNPLLLAQAYVPEPAAMALLAAGACLALRRRRRNESGI